MKIDVMVMLGNCYLEKNYKIKLNVVFFVKVWFYYFGFLMMVLGMKLLYVFGVKFNFGRKFWYYL